MRTRQTRDSANQPKVMRLFSPLDLFLFHPRPPNPPPAISHFVQDQVASLENEVVDLRDGQRLLEDLAVDQVSALSRETQRTMISIVFFFNLVDILFLFLVISVFL